MELKLKFLVIAGLDLLLSGLTLQELFRLQWFAGIETDCENGDFVFICAQRWSATPTPRFTRTSPLLKGEVFCGAIVRFSSLPPCEGEGQDGGDAVGTRHVHGRLDLNRNAAVEISLLHSPSASQAYCHQRPTP